jgi:CRISPR-associated protein Cas1
VRKLLNTLYITKEQAYLTLDGENLVCRMDGKEHFRIPFDNIESVVCFQYVGCSPALMGKCVEKQISISFLAPSGRFLAKVTGETKGNVFLRVAQIDVFREKGLLFAQNTVAAKLTNTIHLIKRTLHDVPELRDNAAISETITALKDGVTTVYQADTPERILGIEGNCAKRYFSIFHHLIRNENFSFQERTKRPPLDPVNALLSFVYTLYTHEFAAALETVGLDSYIGFYHTLRSGRSSLACDLVEEVRCIVERFVLTLVNLKIVSEADFTTQVSGAVWLNDDGRRKVLTHWQEKKRSDLTHPYLRQKIQFGLLPYVQSNLLAKCIRGDLPEYPCFLMK